MIEREKNHPIDFLGFNKLVTDGKYIENLLESYGLRKYLPNSSIDHIAIAYESEEALDSSLKAFLADECTTVISDKHLWEGDRSGGFIVPVEDRKIMAVIENKQTIVLLASHSPGDIIDTFVREHDGSSIHHIALRVSNIRGAIEEVKLLPNFEKITPLVTDIDLDQCFFKVNGELNIIELIERRNDFDGMFTCKNIRQLTEGERLNFSRQ